MTHADEITEAGKKILRAHARFVKRGYSADIMWGGDGQAGILRSAKRLVAQGYLRTPGGSSYSLTDKGKEWCRKYLEEGEV